MLVNVQEWGRFSGGVFQIDDVTRTMSKGRVRLVFHPSKFRPPPPGWLATGLLLYNVSSTVVIEITLFRMKRPRRHGPIIYSFGLGSVKSPR